MPEDDAYEGGIRRSPSYPVFSLKEALSRVSLIYQKDGKASIPRKVAVKHMGYGALSGPAGRSLSALRQFGLISAGGGRVQLTENALELLIYSESDEKYKASIKECSLKPSIYRRLFEQYGESIPSDDALKAELLSEYDFKIKAVNKFISDFKETIALAGLDTKAGGSHANFKKAQKLDEKGQQYENEDGGDLSEPHVVGTTSHSYPIPLGKGNKATILFDRLPVTKGDLDRLKKWVDLMEEPLTEGDKEDFE